MIISLFTNSAINWVAAWAVSPGGPDLICEEHKDGSVTFGMMKPLEGSSLSGAASSWINKLLLNEKICHIIYL
jgi:hypothetical protein